MTAAKPTRIAALVRPLWAWEDGVCPTRELWDDHGIPIRVASRTAAIRACRTAGYKVMNVGGLVELRQDDGREPEWVVTVHPEPVSLYSQPRRS